MWKNSKSRLASANKLKEETEVSSTNVSFSDVNGSCLQQAALQIAKRSDTNLFEHLADSSDDAEEEVEKEVEEKVDTNKIYTTVRK